MKVFCAILMLAVSNGSVAAEPEFSKQYSACMDHTDGSPQDRIACMSAETKRQGAKLEATYKAVLQHTPKDQQERVRQAERDWLKFVSSNCDAYYDAGEQIGGMLAREEMHAQCRMNMAKERNDDLRRLLDVRTM